MQRKGFDPSNPRKTGSQKPCTGRATTLAPETSKSLGITRVKKKEYALKRPCHSKGFDHVQPSHRSRVIAGGLGVCLQRIGALLFDCIKKAPG